MSNRLLGSLEWKALKINSRKNTFYGKDTTGKYFIKIQLVLENNKKNNIKQEFDIIRLLNSKKCQTCPIAHEFGTLDVEFLLLNASEHRALIGSEKKYDYIIQDFIADSGRHDLPDVLLTMIEQKKLGVYQADVKPDNIRYDSENDLCFFVDYDQSILLDEKRKDMRNSEFFSFCSEYDKEYYGIGDWTRHFNNFSEEDTYVLLVDDALDLSKVNIFKNQNTTNTISGVYHTIQMKDVFIKGNRDINKRANILDTIEFFPGERVLDVGCNTGLLSEYLESRGCKVDGFDNDRRITIASSILANISNKNINYYFSDLDYVQKLKKYDTIFLFSVFHHTRDYTSNARKIIESCERIVIETRPHERGSQPFPEEGWRVFTGWNFENLEAMISYLENIFVGFQLKKNHGIGDKNRYILEFVKI